MSADLGLSGDIPQNRVVFRVPGAIRSALLLERSIWLKGLRSPPSSGWWWLLFFAKNSRRGRAGHFGLISPLPWPLQIVRLIRLSLLGPRRVNCFVFSSILLVF